MAKIIYGIPATFTPNIKLNNKNHIEDYEIDDYYDIWCDFEVIENNGVYTVEFETMLGFQNSSKCRDWIIYCLSCMTDYMDRHRLNKMHELSLHQVFTQGVNVNTKFNSLEELYAYLKFVVFGFHGNGLFVSDNNSYPELSKESKEKIVNTFLELAEKYNKENE